MRVYTEYNKEIRTMLDRDIRYWNLGLQNNPKPRYIFIDWKIKEFFAVGTYQIFQLTDKEYKARLETNPKSKSPYVKTHYKKYAKRRGGYIYTTNEQVRNDYKLAGHGCLDV